MREREGERGKKKKTIRHQRLTEEEEKTIRHQSLSQRDWEHKSKKKRRRRLRCHCQSSMKNYCLVGPPFLGEITDLKHSLPRNVGGERGRERRESREDF